MGEIVNLKRLKKCRARARDTALAQQNRVRFGRTGAEKLCDRRAEATRAALLDGRRRELSPSDPPKPPALPED